MTPTLVLFCRRPVPGTGKRRIAAGLGDDFALALAERLLAAALEDAAAWPGPVVLAPADAGDRAWAEGLGIGEVVPQSDGNLGQRLNAVDAALRAAGHRQLCFIGSDAPGLTADFYAAARRALATAPVVLGPATDGGVTLMGAAQPWPDLASLPWSSAGLGAALAAACEAAGQRVRWLPETADVDLPADLPALAAALADDRRPARRALRDWLLAQSLPPVLREAIS